MKITIFVATCWLLFIFATEPPRVLHDSASINVTPTIDEQRIINLNNNYRTSKGMPKLAANGYLMLSARSKSHDLCRSNVWSHNDSMGREFFHIIKESGYKYRLVGENLAYGYESHEEMFQALLESKSHHKNIVGNYTEIGIGYSECNGKKYVAIHYGMPKETPLNTSIERGSVLY